MSKRDVAEDALKLALLIKGLKWTPERAKKALEAMLEGYRMIEEARKQRIKH